MELTQLVAANVRTGDKKSPSDPLHIILKAHHKWHNIPLTKTLSREKFLYGI